MEELGERRGIQVEQVAVVGMIEKHVAIWIGVTWRLVLELARRRRKVLVFLVAAHTRIRYLVGNGSELGKVQSGLASFMQSGGSCHL